VGFELEYDQKGLESREYECDVVFVIIVIFGAYHGYKVLDDNFKSIQDGLELCMLWVKSRGFVIFHDLGEFLS